MAKIYAGENWHENFRSPLTEQGVRVSEGDYILAVDGVPTRGVDNFYRLLDAKGAGVVTLLVNSTPYTAGDAGDSSSIAVATALLLAGAFAYGAIRWGLMHHLALSAVAVLFAGWAYKAAATAAATPWLLVSLGVGLGISGIVRLLRFLATHPVPAGRNAE